MSFTYGTTSTTALAGVTATLQQWPSMGGLELETTSLPGRDGRHFGAATQVATRFAFDVMVAGDTPDQAWSRRDSFIGLVEPSGGPRPLVVEIDEAAGWVVPDVLASGEILWDRLAWQRGLGFIFAGELTLETVGPDPSAREADPQEVTFSSSTSFTLDRGNAAAYPTLLVEGAGGDTTISIGDFEVTVQASSGWNLRMDWDRMVFDRVSSGGARLGSLVAGMDNYARPSLRLGQTVQISVSGSPSQVTLWPNARRI